MWFDKSVQFSKTLGRYHPTDPHVFFGFLGIPFHQYSLSSLLKVLQPWADLVGKRHGRIRDIQAVALREKEVDEDQRAIQSQIPAAYHKYWEVFNEWALYEPMLQAFS